MNNTFNPKRFWWLFRKTILEKPAQFIGFTGLVMVIVFLFYFVFHLPIDRWDGTQRIAFLAGLTGGGTVLASFVFNYFSINSNGCSYLTLPASHFEKWLCAILITGILFPGIFLLFYRIMDISFVTYYHNHLNVAEPGYKQLYNAVHLFTFDHPVAQNVFILFVNFAGIALVGSLYFNKNNFIKTALAFCAVIVLGCGLNFVLAKLFFGNVSDTFPFTFVEIPLSKSVNQWEPVSQSMARMTISPWVADTASLEHSSKTRHQFAILFEYIFPVILWLLAYIRLRDKEF